MGKSELTFLESAQNEENVQHMAEYRLPAWLGGRHLGVSPSDRQEFCKTFRYENHGRTKGTGSEKAWLHHLPAGRSTGRSVRFSIPLHSQSRPLSAVALADGTDFATPSAVLGIVVHIVA